MTTITSNNANYSSYNDYQSGNYEAANDWWGSAGQNGVTDWLTLNPATFPSGTTFDWNWPTVSANTWSPQAYPDVIYVHQWANGNGGGTGALFSNEVPTALSNLSTLTATYNVSLSGNTANSDVLFDLWLTAPGQSNDLNWVTAHPQTEVEIFVHSPTAFGSTSGNFTAGGIVDGNVTVGSNTNGGSTWQTVGITTASDMLSGTLDLNAIFKALEADETISSAEQISDIRLGSEVSGGAGSLAVNNFSVDWQNVGSTSPPPPPPTVSPNDTVVLDNSGLTITDSAHNAWTLATGIVSENSHATASANVTEIAYVNNLVYQENSAGNWWDWNGSAWAATTNPLTTTPPPPPPPPGESPNDTVVLNNSGSHITDSANNLWTVVSGIVDENAKPAGYSANVAEIAYVNHTVYQENSAGSWWDWTGTTWASTSEPAGIVGVVTPPPVHHHGG